MINFIKINATNKCTNKLSLNFRPSEISRVKYIRTCKLNCTEKYL